MMRAPEAPIGCPSATAPPLTLTLSSSMPSTRIELSVTEANASLISHTSMSSAFRPALSSAFLAAEAGVRASPLLGGADQRAAAVIDAWGVARRMRAVLADEARQGRELLQRRVAARTLVDLDDLVPLTTVDRG